MTYTVVGWYAEDPCDVAVPPHAHQVLVTAKTRRLAFDAGWAALDVAAGDEKAWLLNWYVKEQP